MKKLFVNVPNDVSVSALYLASTLLMQLFVIYSKTISHEIYTVIAQLYFYGFATANIVLSYQHVSYSHQHNESFNFYWQSWPNKLIVFAVSMIMPTFAFQFFRQSSVRFGKFDSNFDPFSCRNAKNIFILICVGSVGWLSVDSQFFGWVGAYLVAGFWVAALLIFFIDQFEYCGMVYFQRLSPSALFHVLPDIILVLAPVILISLNFKYLSLEQHVLFLSVMMSTAISGVFSSLLQALAIRGVKPSKVLWFLVVTATLFITSAISITVIGVYLPLIIFVNVLSFMGIWNGFVIKSFREDRRPAFKTLFIILWLILLALVWLIVGQYPTNSVFFGALLLGYLLTIGFSHISRLH